MGVKRFFFILFFLLFSLLIYNLYIIKINKCKKIEKKLYHQTNFVQIQKKKNIINIKTDVINVKINLLGGKIQEVQLLKYREKCNNFKKLQLLSTNCNDDYYIKSGLILYDKKNIQYEKNFLYSANRTDFKLLNGQKILLVPIFTMIKDGIYCTKTFIVKKGSYSIDIEYKIDNKKIYPISFFTFNYFKQIVHSKKSIINFNTLNVKKDFTDIAFSQENIKYTKLSLYNIFKNNIYFMSYSGWFAMLQKYFSIAWILNDTHQNVIYSVPLKNKKIIFGMHSSTLYVLSNQQKIVKEMFWIGPNILNQISLVAPYFDHIINYGWFFIISKLLFKLLNFLYFLVKNWGFAIILITFIIRMLAYPLVKIQYLSAIIMKSLQPEIENIKKKFQHDKKQISKEILQLYAKNNVSPFGGLLSTLIQMPIFLSLYYMLSNSIELRHSSFILWIHDLSSKDPYYVLPIIMGITMFFMQKTSPSSFNNISLQGRIIELLPIVFSFFVLWLPSGLVIYYIMSNLVTTMQQLFIYHNWKRKIIV